MATASNSYDVIVVGAGTAGMPCAIEAAKAGAHVLVLDKAGDVGGTLHVSSGHLSAAGARRQVVKGIMDTPDDHLTDIQRISNRTSREDIARLAVDIAASTIDWLEDNDFEFASETPRIIYGHPPYSIARTFYGVNAGRSVLKVLRRLFEETLATHANLELRLSTPVLSLVMEHGRINGATLADGTIIRAASVVLCTGGFAANPEMFEKIEGVPLVSAAWPTSTGDGLRMAMEHGAALGAKNCFLPTFGGLPAIQGIRIPFDDRPQLVAQDRPPYEIYVDRQGARWVAEDNPDIDAKEHALMEAIPEMTFWLIFDAKALRESSSIVKGWDAAELDHRANRQKGVVSAASITELAQRAGISVEGLQSSVGRYNKAVAAGADEEFGKTFLPAPIAEAPFYALQNHGITLVSRSGVDVNTELQVRRADGSVIPGLYAIGEIIGSAIGGKSFCSGMSVTPAIGFGRRVGKKLGAMARA